MKYNRLGETGLYVSELSFGSWVTFSEKGDENTEKTFQIMKTAYEGGVNFFDNAEAYANGEAETLMGKAVKLGITRKVWTREDLVLSTKLFFGTGLTKGSTGYLPYGKQINRKGLSRKHIIEGMKASLERMGVDCIDLVFCHRYDPLVTMEEIVRAFNFLIDQGLCYYWGTSEWTAEQIREARGIAQRLNMVGPAFDQPEYNLLARKNVEVELQRLYPHVGLTIWSPLAQGILTGKYKDGLPEGSRLSDKDYPYAPTKEKFDDIVNKTEQLRPIAESLGCSLAQLALAWCMSNPNVSTTITGATSVKQIQENLKAVDVIDKLTPEILKKIDKTLGTKPQEANTQKQAKWIRVREIRHMKNFL